MGSSARDRSKGRDEQNKRGTTIPVFLQEGEKDMRSHGNSLSPSLPLAGKQVSCPSLLLLVSAL